MASSVNSFWPRATLSPACTATVTTRPGIGAGTCSGSPASALGRGADSGSRARSRTLISRGWREGADFRYLAFPDGRHEEQSWAMRAHLPFQFFFRE